MIDFKISAHATSQIMTESKGKSKAEKIADLESEIESEKSKYEAMSNKTGKAAENKTAKINALIKQFDELIKQPEKVELSQTCITYLENWVKEQIYGYKFEFDSDQTLKGITVEDDAIQYAASALGWGTGVKKNELSYSSEFMRGTPDLIIDDLVIDIKCPESPKTLPLFAKDLPTKAYYWQLQAYMYLTGKEKAQVTYVMMPTPDDILKKTAFFKAKNIVSPDDKILFDDEFNNIFSRLKDENDFSNLLPKYRVKVFNIERNEKDIEAIIERVKQCRQYIAEHLII